MEIVLATKNKGKIDEIKRMLRSLNISFFSLYDFPDYKVEEETGNSFMENAVKKAERVSLYTGRIALGDDSGLEVDYLEKRPGIHSARYGGIGLSDEKRNEKLLKELEGVPPELRGASFRCALALIFPDGMKELVEGECRGMISLEPSGKNGFGYDPIFLIPDLGKTIAELSPQMKDKISHRGRAIMELRNRLAFLNF